MKRILFDFDPECEKSDQCLPNSHISQCYHCMASQYFESRRDLVRAFKAFRESLNFFEPDFESECDLSCAFKLDVSHLTNLFDDLLNFSLEFDHLVSVMPDQELLSDE